MWKKMKTPILIFSVTLNMAFIAMWVIHAFPTHFGCIGLKADSNAKSCISCPLHRKLGTSEKQWQEIEPRLVEFKTSSQAVCRKTNQLRKELIDLIAAPQTDIEAIRAKQDKSLRVSAGCRNCSFRIFWWKRRCLHPNSKKHSLT